MHQPFEIVWAKLLWRDCPDERPWLLIDVRKGGETYGAFPISGKLYQSGGACMIVPADHADFPDTGLTERSHIYYDSTIEVGDDEIRRASGRLTGELLENLKLTAGL